MQAMQVSRVLVIVALVAGVVVLLRARHAGAAATHRGVRRAKARRSAVAPARATSKAKAIDAWENEGGALAP